MSFKLISDEFVRKGMLAATRDMLINDLNKIWYRLVSLDHHKDRDCHWVISLEYSYGKRGEFKLSHSGYLYNQEVTGKFKTLDLAKIAMVKHMQKAIVSVIEGYQKAEDDEHSVAVKLKNSGIEKDFASVLSMYGLSK